MDTDTPKIDAKHAILLVMDYQNGILGRLPEFEKLVDRMADMIAFAREHGLHIGYVRVGLADEDYDKVPAHNKMFRAAADSRGMHADSEDTAIHSKIEPESGDIVVRKSRVGAFSTTDLDKQLKEKGIHTLILAGVSTSGVVLSTVRDAADKDYQVYVLEDLSADFDPEVHKTLTQKVFPRQAHVITDKDLRTLIAK